MGVNILKMIEILSYKSAADFVLVCLQVISFINTVCQCDVKRPMGCESAGDWLDQPPVCPIQSIVTLLKLTRNKYTI